MHKSVSLAWTALALVTVAACSAQFGQRPDAAGRGAPEFDLQVARAPFEQVDVNWKHRLDQPYVYVEALGSYTLVGRALDELFSAVRAQGVEASGPPFVLYYDDPGRKPTSELRLRACIPTSAGAAAALPLAYDVLPSTTVVYAYVAGPYPEAPRAYPALFSYLARMNWVENGPIREVYYRSPAEVKDWSELVCEIQLPAGMTR
jgi:effector-binding domain-containing protein